MTPFDSEHFRITSRTREWMAAHAVTTHEAEMCFLNGTTLDREDGNGYWRLVRAMDLRGKLLVIIVSGRTVDATGDMVIAVDKLYFALGKYPNK
jgi:hypothetical protein